ncbi:MAG: hypothetical protein IPK27_17200 [Rhodanobacteraceae bacterium]|nr:hypothetical protein [Rhodanobacteraceae bacterium]
MKSQLLLATVALACAASPMCAQASAAATFPPDEQPVIPEYMPEPEVMFGDIAPAAQESAASAEPTAEVSSESGTRRAAVRGSERRGSRGRG